MYCSSDSYNMETKPHAWYFLLSNTSVYTMLFKRYNKKILKFRLICYTLQSQTDQKIDKISQIYYLGAGVQIQILASKSKRKKKTDLKIHNQQIS